MGTSLISWYLLIVKVLYCVRFITLSWEAMKYLPSP